MNIEIKLAYEDLDNIKALFMEYAQSLEVDLCFQDFNQELDSLPGKYAFPDGRLYIAYLDDKVVGCIALRRYDENRSELKRMYIRNGYRGLGISKILVQKIIQDAIELKYESILLDTLNTMKPAINLYKSFGFEEIEPYYVNPLDGATYFSLNLSKTKVKL
jgi:ribosomal protein S18 acetylase RimI-like enzyme